MKLKLTKKKWTIIAALIATTATLAYCAATDNSGAEAGGTVIDVSTNLPVEGAYVLSVYNESGGTLFGHSGHWCVKTKGMYTGKDGKFHFSLEKSPYLYLHVIKPDYFQTVDGADIKRPAWDGRGENPYTSDPNLYLKPQDPAKPEYSSYVHCERAKNRVDVEALLEYLKLKLAELVKYNDKHPSVKDMQRSIQQLESWPR